MFGLPEAKRVRRSELHSSSAESSPDPKLQDLFLERLARQQDEGLSLAIPVGPEPREELHEDQGQPEDEVEFRLFAPSSTLPEGPISRIRLKSPEPSGKLVVQRRPDFYYFANKPSATLKSRFLYSAVSGADVLSRSRIPWPGCKLPWRVITVTKSGEAMRLTNSAPLGVEEGVVQRRRKRKGKKARIALRKQIAAEKLRVAGEAVGKEEKELQERIKRAKRNREKKLKQREKAKRKKTKATGEALDGALDHGKRE